MLFILGICSGESTKGFFRGKIRGVCRRGLAVAAIMCEEHSSEDILHCEIHF